MMGIPYIITVSERESKFLLHYEFVSPKELESIVHLNTWHYSLTSMHVARTNFLKCIVSEHRIYHLHELSVTQYQLQPLLSLRFG